MPGGWVCFMTNRPNGTLYVGVTSDLARRVQEHRDGVADGFTKRYGLTNWFMPSFMKTFVPPSSVRKTSSIGRAHGRSV